MEEITTKPQLIIICLTAFSSYAFNFNKGVFVKMGEDTEGYNPRESVLNLLGSDAPEFPILVRITEDEAGLFIDTLPTSLLTAGLPTEPLDYESPFE